MNININGNNMNSKSFVAIAIFSLFGAFSGVKAQTDNIFPLKLMVGIYNAGHFNAVPQSQTIALIREKWTDATGSTPTWPNPGPATSKDSTSTTATSPYSGERGATC
jgi:hypothetical protein